ncbi:MAG TPA: hypothetical protein VJ851_08570 [Jatrophihabitans sp.]|nr:hypothetical protein [Jatrophihabitans sp.]
MTPAPLNVTPARRLLSHGLGYQWPSRVGGLLAIAGLLIALTAGWWERRTEAGELAELSEAGRVASGPAQAMMIR